MNQWLAYFKFQILAMPLLAAIVAMDKTHNNLLIQTGLTTILYHSSTTKYVSMWPPREHLSVQLLRRGEGGECISVWLGGLIFVWIRRGASVTQWGHLLVWIRRGARCDSVGAPISVNQERGQYDSVGEPISVNQERGQSDSEGAPISVNQERGQWGGTY